MPGLDVLRGVAVLSVFAFHGLKLHLPEAASMGPYVRQLGSTVSFGWLGVNLFFLLSGFLITGILIDTRKRTNYWKSFYLRRVLRIMPLYLVVLVVIRLANGSSWLYIFLCLVNLANFANLRMPGEAYGPLWSLAVEEQFYLVWPFVVRRLSLRALGAICIVGILITPILRALSVANILPLGDAYSTTWLVCDNLFYGALLAIFLRSAYSTERRVRFFTAISGGVGVLLMGMGWKLHWMSRVTPAGGAFQSIPFLLIFCCVLLLALQFGARPMIFRVTTPLRFFGYISYGFYLLHVIAFSFFDELWARFRGPVGTLRVEFVLARFVVVTIGVTIVCWVSRRYFEEYFLRFKDKLVPYETKAS
jgi:peptidoglycan/LPS O-acetylase OafA/YrhL